MVTGAKPMPKKIPSAKQLGIFLQTGSGTQLMRFSNKLYEEVKLSGGEVGDVLEDFAFAVSKIALRKSMDELHKDKEAQTK